MKLPDGIRIQPLDVVLPEDHPVCLCHLTLSSKHGLPRGIRVRIERPTHLAGAVLLPERSRHAHIEERAGKGWRDIYVVNRDGTGSHGTPAGTVIDERIAEVLRQRGFAIGEDNRVGFLSRWHERWLLPLLRNEGVKSDRQIILVIFDLGSSFGDGSSYNRSGL